MGYLKNLRELNSILEICGKSVKTRPNDRQIPSLSGTATHCLLFSREASQSGPECMLRAEVVTDGRVALSSTL